MPGTPRRPGAIRKPGSKKPPRVGTGGHSRQALEGRGPTPKAEDRPNHPAARRKAAAERDTGRPNRPQGRTGSVTEMVAGRNAVVEALRAGVPVQTLYVAQRLDSDDRTREILQTAAARRLALLEVSRAELDRLTDGSVHQGIAAQVPAYTYADPEDLLDAAERSGRPALIVALDGVTDPRNVGAVLRSAGAFGAHGVVVPTRRAAGVTASAWKVSAGAAARVPVARVTNLARGLESLRQAGCFVVGLDAQGGTALADLPFVDDPLVLVVGSEGKGLSRLVRERCDAMVSIPLSSTVESLNAGVAAGIALYEVARRRSPA